MIFAGLGLKRYASEAAFEKAASELLKGLCR